MTELRDDIPFPVDRQPQKPGRKPKYPFRTMGVGDSFPVGDNGLKNVRSLASRQSKAGKAEFKVGLTDVDGVEEWRCWRLA